MAKTNWVLNEIVMPADMNQIGTEINAKAEINNTILTGTETLGDRWCRRTLGTALSLPNSPNQKIRISLPSLNFGGNIKLTVLGSYNALNLNGIMEKSFTGNLVGNNQNFEGSSNYEKVYSAIQTSNGFLNSCQISDLKSDSNGFFFDFCVSVSTITHVFSFFLEAKNSSGVNLSDIIKGASLGTFYADTLVLPKAIVQESQMQLTAPQGTSPLIVTSTTKVDNLNSETTNGWRFVNSLSELQLSNNATIQEIITALDGAKIQVLLPVNGTNNVNYSLSGRFGLLDIKNSSPDRCEILFYDNNGTISIGKFTSTGRVFGGWNSIALNGSQISATQLTSTAPQGTAPIVVTSNTKVDNLNVDYVNGWKMYRNLSELGISTLSNGINQILDAMGNSSKLTLDLTNSLSTAIGLPTGGGILFLNIGTTGFRTASATLRNGDFYNGVFSGLVFSSWKQISLNGSPISSTQFTSTAPQGTTPLVVTSNTKVHNLNSDLLDDMHADVTKTASTIVSRKSDGGINAGGFSSFEQIGVKLPGRNRELRLTQDANNISYIQLVNDSGGFISNTIQINADGTAGFNVSTNAISYSNPASPQFRNTHVGNTAPSNSLGINGDIYIEL